jgi:predicted HTH domain antitoxin
MKTLSVAEVSREGVTKALRAAEAEPLLVRRGDEPVVWMVSAREIARLAEQSGGDVAQTALQAIAVHLFDEGALSMGQAARLLGMRLDDFIALCDRLQVPVLREPESGIDAEVDAFDSWLRSIQTDAGSKTP